MQVSGYTGVSNYYGGTPATEMDTINSLSRRIKVLESRLDQIICLLETIARKPEKKKLNIEGDTRCQMINLG